MLTGAVAHAQDAQLGFADLGLGERVELGGLTASQTFVIARNPDAAPTTLSGRATASLDSSRARLEIIVGGASAQVIDVAQPPNGTPFSVSLANAATTPQGIVVEFRTTMDPTDRYCLGQASVPMIALDRLSVTYAQDAKPPVDIASFMPPIVRSVGIWVPSIVSEPIATAALRLASGLTQRAGALPLSIEVRTLASADSLPATPYNPFRRDIVIRPRGTGTTLEATTFADGLPGAPVLVLGGDDVALQADLVNSVMSKVLVTDSSGVAGKATAAVLPKREQRLTDLGLTATTASGTGKVKLGLNVSQSSFGGMVKAMTLRISGRHTPIGPKSAAGISVFVNGALVSTARSSSKGTFNVRTTILEPTLDRNNSIEVIAEERGDHGPCSANALPIELQVSTDSTTEATAGPSLPVTFRRLPQAFLPSTAVALVDQTPSTLATAVAILSGFQRLSTLPIDAQVIPFRQAATSTRPTLIVAHGDEISGITRKIIPGSDQQTVTDIGNRRVRLTADVATLQFIDQAGRSIVLADGPSGDHTLQLAQKIAALPNGFADLAGDIALVTNSGELTRVQFSDDRPVATAEPAPATPWKWVAASVAGIFVALILAVVIGSRRRRRAKRRRS